MENENTQKIKAGKSTMQVSCLENIPDVELTPVKVLGQSTPYQAIVEKPTDRTLHVVSDVYQLLPHKEVFEAVDKLEDYNISLGQIYKDGKRLVIELSEKKEVKHELLPGDYYHRKVRILNSYDCSMGLSVLSYGMRLVCKNGMMAPGFQRRIHKVHAHGTINLDDLDKYVEYAMESWNNTDRIFQVAYHKVIKLEDAVAELKYFPQKYMDLVQKKVKDKDTVYNIWNAFTNVISHDISGNVNMDAVIWHQKQANKIFNLVKKDLKEEVKWANER